jgi:hypothetical protein
MRLAEAEADHEDNVDKQRQWKGPVQQSCENASPWSAGQLVNMLRWSVGLQPRSALAARAEGIPDGLVRAFPLRSLLWKWRVRRLAAQGRAVTRPMLQTDSGLCLRRGPAQAAAARRVLWLFLRQPGDAGSGEETRRVDGAGPD